ncbi:MAG TPA: hypothetical protein VK530_06990 [Candidatus Acidoferrum sp.]|nr:hypothetical protein [Candidatus Acidoferrum sp.]
MLINKVTGRYYHAPGHWVRRSDNALTFNDVSAAQQFSRAHHINNAHPVQRLAPYVMELLQRPCFTMWETWSRAHASGWAEWYSTPPAWFTWN